MNAPRVGGITEQSTALMPLLGLAPQSLQLGLNRHRLSVIALDETIV